MSQELSNVEHDRIGHYVLLEKIAEGGFGVVYTAEDTRLRRQVAVKILHAYHATEPNRVARFLREARSAAKLQHPGIVQVYDVIESEGRMALVMELIRGETLDCYLKRHPNLSLADKLEIAAQVAETLYAAHETGVIHRDVKPANVLIDESGRVKLTDFSLARLLDNSLTQLTGENNVLGTPAYMSPEQCEGRDAIPQSDLYSLGVIVYEMATGAVPFEAENYLAVLRLHTDTPPTPVRLVKPTLPQPLEDLVMRCLAKDSNRRPENGLAMAEELRRIAREQLDESGEPISNHGTARTPTPMPRKITPSPRPIGASSSGVQPLETAPQPDAHELQAPQAPPQVAPVAAAPPPAVDEPESAGTGNADGMPVETQEPQVPAPSVTWRRPGINAALATAAVLLLGAAVFLAARQFSGDSIQISVPSLRADAPLLKYVQETDDNYAFSVLPDPLEGEGYTAYIIDMTSQAWHPDKVKPRQWRHWLTVIVPDRANQDKALLVLAAGLSSANEPLSEVPAPLAEIATSTKAIVAVFEGFPRDPVGFYGESDQAPDLSPDEFAVASFARFLETGDPTWPIVCPVVKATVRAMDTVQTFTEKHLDLDVAVESFVLTGAGNGWGVWLTGAVDKRVAGLAPIQFGLVDISNQVDLQVGHRAELSPFFELFSKSGVMADLETEDGEKLLQIIDPYSYRAQLAMPKLLLLPAGGDSYASVDSAELYFDELTGDKYLFCAPHQAPNDESPLLYTGEKEKAPVASEEGMLMLMPPTADEPQTGAQQMRDTLRVFFHRLLVDKPMPRFTWEISPEGAFKVATQDEPAEVRLWVAHSETRDFPTAAGGQLWHMDRLSSRADGTYEGSIAPAKGKFTAFCLELVYPSKLGVNFSLTTPVHVVNPAEIPNKLACHAESSLPFRRAAN